MSDASSSRETVLNDFLSAKTRNITGLKNEAALVQRFVSLCDNNRHYYRTTFRQTTGLKPRVNKSVVQPVAPLITATA